MKPYFKNNYDGLIFNSYNAYVEFKLQAAGSQASIAQRSLSVLKHCSKVNAYEYRPQQAVLPTKYRTHYEAGL